MEEKILIYRIFDKFDIRPTNTPPNKRNIIMKKKLYFQLIANLSYKKTNPHFLRDRIRKHFFQSLDPDPRFHCADLQHCPYHCYLATTCPRSLVNFFLVWVAS